MMMMMTVTFLALPPLMMLWMSLCRLMARGRREDTRVFLASRLPSQLSQARCSTLKSRAGFCKECQSYGSWDRSTERFRLWKEAHAPTCSLNYRGSSNSMEQHGAVLMWGRSLELHKLRYTTFIGDGDSSSFKSVIYANHLVFISDCDCCAFRSVLAAKP